MITCVVSDGIGNCVRTVTNITITAPKSPSLSEQPPRHINTSEGLDLNMTCKSLELPRPAITWFKNGVHVTRHNVTWYRGTSTLMLRSIVLDDEGEYWCRVNNSLGKVVSMGTNITVFAQPKFVKSPVNQNVTMGTDVTLTCEVSGRPLPMIGWMRDGQDLVTGSQIAQARGIVGNDVTPVEVPSAVAVTSTQNLSSSSSLSLLSSPSLITTSSSFLHSSSSKSLPTLFSSSSSLSSLSSSFSSSKSPLPLPSSAVKSPSSSPLSLSTSSSPLSPSPLLQSSKSPSTSIIDHPVSSTTSLSSVIASESSQPPTTTSISPSTTAEAQPASLIPTAKPKPPFSGSIKQHGAKSTLRIKSAAMNDQANYSCYASNGLGNAKSGVAFLAVYNQDKAPFFKVAPRNSSALQGMNVTLNCSATGFPTPNITWYKNYTLFTTRDRVSMTMTEDMTSLLTISMVSRDDEDVYMCKAANKLGFVDSTGAFLKVIPEVSADSTVLTISNKKQVALWSAVGALLVLLLVVMVILVVFFVRRRRAGHAQSPGTTIVMSSQNGMTQKVPYNEELLDDLVYLRLMGIDRDWELPRDRLQRTNDKLGSGCFGNVYSGVYTRKDGKEMLVAVKMLKVNASDEDRSDLMAELEILKQVGRHPNIVSLVGACTKDEPICVVIELVEGGNLYDLLRKTRIPYEKQTGYENIRSSLTDRDLVKIALDTAKGMSHLHKKQCIHRDLAARNVLIGKGLVAKIADFGLARTVPSDGLYVKTTGGKVPWKWMAPEALRGLSTKQSDIWSFGVLLWEIATLGDTPYLTTTQVIPLYNLLVDGYRLEKPPQCDELLYELMMACWSVESDARPGFDDIQCILQDILNQNKRVYINLVAMELEDEILEHSF